MANFSFVKIAGVERRLKSSRKLGLYLYDGKWKIIIITITTCLQFNETAGSKQLT